MPFDRFLTRKIESIKKKQNRFKLPFIDCVGTSLTHELSYFWNGYNRMPTEHLELTLKLLDYHSSINALIDEDEDEKMIRCTLQAITYRRLGQIALGRKLLDEMVLSKIIIFDSNLPGGSKLIKLNHDPWLYPTALYERALFTWKESDVDGLDECKKWLHHAQTYEDDYELSARISMKIKGAIDRLDGLQL